jgi:hypothetical protein
MQRQDGAAGARGGVRAYSAGSSQVMTLIPISLAAVSTAGIMYPVDVMRALSMASAGSKEPFSISAYYQKFGLKGFVSKGVVPELAKSSVMRISKFFFFPILCNQLHGKEPAKCSVGEKAIAGALATVPEILMISPLEVAKIGIQLDVENKYKNNSRAFLSDLYKSRGASAMYCGWAGMQWRQSWWTGTFFATLGSWKGLVEPPLKEVGVPQPMSQIISGFLAGVFASIPNAPGDVVRSVVQKKLFLDPKRPAYGVSPQGVIEHFAVAGEIVKNSGLKGLYAGFGFKALHLGGSGALMAGLIPFFANLVGIPYSGV